MSVFTQDQYQKLISAIAQGVTTVKYADKEVTYRSFQEMMELKGVMEKDLGISKPQGGRYFASTSKGLFKK